MKQSLWIILLMVLLVSSRLEATETSKSPEQKALEMTDFWCVQNHDDFTIIDRMANVYGGKEMESSLSSADAVLHKLGGSAYSYEYEGMLFIVAYANNGGCTVASEGVDNQQMEQLLLKNYSLSLFGSTTSGTDIQKVFRFENPSPYKGGLISMNYAKPEVQISALSVSFIPSNVYQKLQEKR